MPAPTTGNRLLGRSGMSMSNALPTAVFLVLFLLCLFVAVLVGGAASLALREAGIAVGVLVGAAGLVLSAIVASGVKVVNQWEQALILRLGKFKEIRGPGFFVVIPIVDQVRTVDLRVLTEDIRRQEVITRDNVPVAINGVLFFKVVAVQDAVMKIQDYVVAVGQLAQTALRDVVGKMTLDELLAEREQIGKQIEQIFEKDSREWGLEVTAIRLQDIDMPEDLKKIMSRQASAEREKRATITKAEGDRMAADNLAAAAMTMAASPGAMQLRTLQTIDGLGPTASNTVVLAVPIEILELSRTLNTTLGSRRTENAPSSGG